MTSNSRLTGNAGGCMRRIAIAAGILILTTSPLHAAGRHLACYLDGGVLIQEVAATKGYVEVSLPAGMVHGSLRVKPGRDVIISRVQTVPAKVDPKTEKALALLDERRELLGDRLKALQTREEIFTAAARSQSAKAPRKSKGNPEPVTAIRQGTDLALARLEEVYRTRRATEREIKTLEARRAELARRARVGGSVARIWLQGKGGTVTVECAAADAGWKPVYDLRLDGAGHVTVTLRALLPETEAGTEVTVTPSRLDSASSPSAPLPAAGDYAAVATCTLPAVASPPPSPLAPLSVTLTNETPALLPAGDASCFWRGEFRGTARLPDLGPGERKEIVCGATPAAPAPPAPAGK